VPPNRLPVFLVNVPGVVVSRSTVKWGMVFHRISYGVSEGGYILRFALLLVPDPGEDPEPVFTQLL
jgi:hypothetical protein